MHFLSIFTFEVMFVFAAGILTDISQWPGWDDTRDCVKQPFSCSVYGCLNVWGYLGCHDWNCVCGHFSEEFTMVSSAASSYCSGEQQDVASATSIFNGFCAQYSISITAPTAPTLITAPSAPIVETSETAIPVPSTLADTLTPSGKLLLISS